MFEIKRFSLIIWNAILQVTWKAEGVIPNHSKTNAFTLDILKCKLHDLSRIRRAPMYSWCVWLLDCFSWPHACAGCYCFICVCSRKSRLFQNIHFIVWSTPRKEALKRPSHRIFIPLLAWFEWFHSEWKRWEGLIWETLWLSIWIMLSSN